MSRFYVEPEFVRQDRIYVRGKQQHHIQDVMRLDIGDEVVAFDGTGAEYKGVIEDSSSREVVIKVTRKEIAAKKLPEITLGVSVPKLDRMDFVIQKSTELGVDRIIPLLTERTIVLLDEKKAASRAERWRNIAIEASKQSGRAQLPAIEPLTKFSAGLSRIDKYDIALLPTLQGEPVSLKEALKDKACKNAILFIGPEGDFTPAEVREAKKAGCVCVSLGPLVLRVETAAIAALAVLFYELSNEAMT